jgi:site-specific DNA-methyltransferase (adenine-specific)
MTDARYFIGDSRVILKSLPSSSIHLVVTSPPYWNAKDYGGSEQIGFSQTYEEYLSDLGIVWRECERLLVANGKICVNLQPLPVPGEMVNGDRSSILNIMADVEAEMKRLGLSLSNIFIWDKRKYNNQRIFGSYPYPPNLYSHIAFEYIYVFRKPGPSRVMPHERKDRSKLSQKEWSNWCFNSIWDIPPVIKYGPRDYAVQSHIAPFPIEIPRRLIRLFSFAGDTVLDPFLGCGTTLGACLLEERNGIGIELQSRYEPLIKLMLKDPKHLPKYELAESLEHTRKLTEFVEANE